MKQSVDQVKRIALLGASGSIGRNAIEIIKRSPDTFQVACLSTHTNVDFLVEHALAFRPESVAITGNDCNPKQVSLLREKGINVFFGKEGLMQAISACEFDVLVNALVGAVGLLPTLAAIDRGKRIAIANKETLVMAGELVTAKARQQGASLIPIDSEHSAIFQCLLGESNQSIRRIIITGSGGPFLNRDKDQFDGISVDEALAHPNWDMGRKITIDSATLMNKGLEIIEAYWLFDVPLEKIELVIHPQSIVHSLVEFIDGSIKAQLGYPDMKVPIQYALSYPERVQGSMEKLDLIALHKLTFFQPDFDKFPNLQLALKAIQMGGTAPAVLNGANEEAVRSFLNEKISFKEIPELNESALLNTHTTKSPNLQEILEADQWSRKFVQDQIQRKREKHSIVS